MIENYNFQRYRFGQLIASPDPSLTAIKLGLDALFQNDNWHEWDPATITFELNDAFGDTESEVAANRIAAIPILLDTDGFFRNLKAFMPLVNTISGGDPGFVSFNPVSVAEISWAVVETALLRDTIPFNQEIKRFVQVVLKQEGLDNNPPEVIKSAFFDEDEFTKQELEEIITANLSTNLKESIDKFIREKLIDIYKELSFIGLTDELEKMFNKRQLEKIKKLEI